MILPSEPVWLSAEDAEAIVGALAELYPDHRVQVVRPHSLGGALERACNRYHYNSERNLFRLAADYVYSLGKAHALVDGNKRLAFMSALVFLELNGFRLNEPEDQFFAVFVKALMADRINVEMLAMVFQSTSERLS
ncbi:toxin-antitoxin system, toxin component, Fic family [Roseibium sp. TrichSKD4]|uniref:type II toxin-antitoxin system death-on-curing family toxin n=1 Tax=Roseibium sp. TrichSKD4 TaxID=744980 RepID=UPI0001E56176|nr:type II toxin-antitoxin system death-on-curing family toxin [Roseibium sp. TrichSKD4]EFO34400.1 toxin-antitoxin system, toxin component, Fic family [Roseibium sp. TrichSKD4]